MGWLRFDDGLEEGHEGYALAVVRDGHGWRELGLDDEPQVIRYVQVGCDCGWRSPRMTAPLDARFSPSHVDWNQRWLTDCFASSDDYEDAASELWSAHVDEVIAGAGIGRMDLGQRARRVWEARRSHPVQAR